MRKPETSQHTFRRASCPQSLVGTLEVVVAFPKPKAITSFLRIMELLTVKQVLVSGPMRSFHDPISPGFSFGDQGMNHSPALEKFVQPGLAESAPFGEFHGEHPGIIGPH